MTPSVIAVVVVMPTCSSMWKYVMHDLSLYAIYIYIYIYTYESSSGRLIAIYETSEYSNARFIAICDISERELGSCVRSSSSSSSS